MAAAQPLRGGHALNGAHKKAPHEAGLFLKQVRSGYTT